MTGPILTVDHRPAAPRAVQLAVVAMCAAALALFAVVASLIPEFHLFRDEMVESFGGTGMDRELIDAVTFGVAVVSGGWYALEAAAWAGLAVFCRAGKGWARIVVTVLVALRGAEVLLDLGTSLLTGGYAPIGTTANVVSGVLAAVAALLLWSNQSRAYFSRPAPPPTGYPAYPVYPNQPPR